LSEAIPTNCYSFLDGFHRGAARYVFREFALSYMGRFDLAHVDPFESHFDAMGKGVEEGKQPEQPNNKYLSKGLTRSSTDNLVLMRSSPSPSPLGGPWWEGWRTQCAGWGAPNVTSMASHGPTARVSDTLEGAVALNQEARHDQSPTEKLEALQWSKAGAAHRPDRAVQGRTPCCGESQRQ
jgi:ribonucleoside-diphosphate reductase alpha chain